MYDLEVGVADKILQLHQQEIPDQESDVDAYLEGYAESNRVSFSQEQVLAVKNAILFPVSVVAGHPGTGKTFCTRAIVRYFQRQNKKIFLMAPTGIAAKRLEQVVGESATTIHRALRFNGEVFAHNEDSPLNADVVLIDETSMLGLPLLASLLAAIPSDARVIFVGDPAQLPSVEPGYVLSDMISSGVIAYSHLTQIYRQEEASDIILWAHAIHRGDSPDLRPPSQSDVVFLSSASDEEASQAIVNLVRSLHKKNSERDTPLTFQVLSPRYKGIAGVDDLNQRLRDLLNPAAKTQEIRIDGQVYRVNDRIMITKNDYKLDIFNGETGKIDSVNLRTKSLVVRIYDDPHPRHVELLFKDVPHKLTLAYAVTTHKFQGQEVDVILMPCVSSFGYQLERHLIYTGLTRAKKKAFIVGQWPSLLRAIQTNRTEDRQGALIERLSENLNH